MDTRQSRSCRQICLDQRGVVSAGMAYWMGNVGGGDCGCCRCVHHQIDGLLGVSMERNPGYVSVGPMRRWDEREGRGMDEGVGGCGGVRVSESEG